MGYQPKLEVDFNFVKLLDASGLRGFEVEINLGLAEFIWMTCRRNFNNRDLDEVNVRGHSILHQRYTHALPHEGTDATKTIDRDIYCMEEKVIMTASELDAYREGTLPAALTGPVSFTQFNTTQGVPSHTNVVPNSQRSYAELKCIEFIFDGDTRYIFTPAPDEVITDGSSGNGPRTDQLHMYFFDPIPTHPAQIDRFNDYSRDDLVGLELQAIMGDFQ